MKNENTWRLRAVVRAALSRAVWLALLLHLLPSLLVLEIPVLQKLRGSLFMVAVMAYLYVASGLMHTAAQHRDPVLATAAVQAASAVYGRFLWLVLRAVFLVALLLIVTGLLPQVINTDNLLWTGLAATGVRLLFVWWLPFVFHSGQFALFDSVAEALKLLQQHRARLVFLAPLLLLPALAAAFTPPTAPLAIVLLVGAILELSHWAGYLYCAEVLLRAAEAPVPADENAPQGPDSLGK